MAQGALGNEVLKNLALMGIGNIIIADFDTIEDSNLSRSVLFRASDRGRRKVDAAAEAVKELNPDVNVKTWHGNINFEMGLGVFRHVDAIIGCLDNREARLSINRFSWQINRPWVDGAIQELMGIVRVFWPGQGACYECTLTDMDYQIINLRYSCPLLARQNILQGKVPTTPTSASIVAAFQTQEALKLIHGMEVTARPGDDDQRTDQRHLHDRVSSKKWLHESFAMLDPIVEVEDGTAVSTTLAQLLAIAQEKLAEDTVLEFDGEIVTTMTCLDCGEQFPIFRKMARLYENESTCPNCGGHREMALTHRIDGSEDFLDRTLAEMDVPPLGIIRARSVSQKEEHLPGANGR